MPHKKYDFSVNDVSQVYAGPGGKLWELLMGEQIHVGGEEETTILAQKVGLANNSNEVHLLDICSALGGPARQLVNDYGIYVVGLDITLEMIKEAKNRTQEKKYESLVEYRLGSGLDIPAHSESFDIVWGQDAWCYIRDKYRLIEECHRVLKPNGILGFTDWIWGPSDPPEKKADYLMEFMVFPDMETLGGYDELIVENRMQLKEKEDLGDQFAMYMDHYLKILKNNKDNIIQSFGTELYAEAEKGVTAWNEAAHKKWVSRGRWIAEKP
jgi:ubiquinone/menaquinone biosynthesis C-methylase UbiE